MEHPVFVPKLSTLAQKTIAKGSAVVGQEYEQSGYLVYYENNLYGAENIRTFEDKAMLAAGRMEENYPTVAKMLCHYDDLILVGYFETQGNVFTPIDDDHAYAVFAQWIG